MKHMLAVFVVAFMLGLLTGGLYIGSAITEQVDASWIAKGCK